MHIGKLGRKSAAALACFGTVGALACVALTAAPAEAATTSCMSRTLDGGGQISGVYGDGLTVNVKNVNTFGVLISNVTAQPNWKYGGPLEEPQQGSVNGVPIDLLPGQSASFYFSFGPSSNNTQDWLVTVDIPDGGDESSVQVAVNLASTACHSTNPEIPDIDATGLMNRLHGAWNALTSTVGSFYNTTIGTVDLYGVAANYFYTSNSSGSWYNLVVSGPTGSYYYSETPGQGNWTLIGTQAPGGSFTPTNNPLPPTGPRGLGDGYGYGIPLPGGGQIGGYGTLGGSDGGISGDGDTGSCITVMCRSMD